MHPDGLLAALVNATPGLCVFCEEALPEKSKRKPRIVCGSSACRTAYHAAYKRDERMGIQMLEARCLAFFTWCAGGSDVAPSLSVPGNGGEGA